MVLSKASIILLITSIITCASCPSLDRCLIATRNNTDLRVSYITRCRKLSQILDNLAESLYSLNEEHLFNLACTLLSRVVPRGHITLDGIVKCREYLLRVIAPWLSDDEIALLVLSSLGLSKIAPLLLDETVEDVYVSDQVAFSVKVGGVIEQIDLGESDRTQLVQVFTKLAQLAGYELSLTRPTATFTVKVCQYRFRVTVDVWPVASHVTIHVRSLRALFTLDDLVKLGTLTREQAQMLINHVLNGGNVLIVGPPGSGKTTLLVALDLALPRDIRRVYIDEFDEFPDVEELPQLKYRSVYGRVREIEHVLVRGGGLLIIGELRSRDHFDALKLALESGLQVLATIHAGTLDELRLKIRSFMGDHVKLLSGNTLLVFMEVRGTIRRVRDIQLLND